MKKENPTPKRKKKISKNRTFVFVFIAIYLNDNQIYGIMQKRGFGKKAQIEHEMYYILAQLLLIVLVGFALFSFVDTVSQGNLYHKKYLARDIAFITNTIYAAPGDISYIYPGDVSEFIINFRQDNQVEVYEELEIYEKMHPSKISYPFLVDQNIDLKTGVISPDLDMSLEYEDFQLIINKDGKTITPQKNE